MSCFFLSVSLLGGVFFLRKYIPRLSLIFSFLNYLAEVSSTASMALSTSVLSSIL